MTSLCHWCAPGGDICKAHRVNEILWSCEMHWARGGWEKMERNSIREKHKEGKTALGTHLRFSDRPKVLWQTGRQCHRGISFRSEKKVVGALLSESAAKVQGRNLIKDGDAGEQWFWICLCLTYLKIFGLFLLTKPVISSNSNMADCPEAWSCGRKQRPEVPGFVLTVSDLMRP